MPYPNTNWQYDGRNVILRGWDRFGYYAIEYEDNPGTIALGEPGPRFTLRAGRSRYEQVVKDNDPIIDTEE